MLTLCNNKFHSFILSLALLFANAIGRIELEPQTLPPWIETNLAGVHVAVVAGADGAWQDLEAGTPHEQRIKGLLAFFV